jgi:hypothetical protein
VRFISTFPPRYLGAYNPGRLTLSPVGADVRRRAARFIPAFPPRYLGAYNPSRLTLSPVGADVRRRAVRFIPAFPPRYLGAYNPGRLTLSPVGADVRRRATRFIPMFPPRYLGAAPGSVDTGRARKNSPGVSKPASPARRWLRRFVRLAAVAALLLMAALLVWFRGALYHRFVRFPREEAAWQALRTQRQPVTEDAGWKEFRGILHSHSEFSHDCEVPFEEILAALQTARLDFICLSDHCVEGRADFDRQWRGLHDGKLFIPGFEMKEGIMPFGVAPGVVLSNRTDSATLAREIVEHGGVLFYAHPEERRDWNRPELTGMEIYNLHSDFKRRGSGLVELLPDLLVNLERYPDHLFRQIFTRPDDFLRRWDDLNRTRHITGIAGNDCHQNVGLRAFYTERGTIRVEDTSPKTLREIRLNGFTRPVARLIFGRLEPGRKLFHVQLDPYERSARFVNTHLLARELTESAVLDSLRAGRVFVGFDLIADSAGFRWFASNPTTTVVLGEALTWSDDARLHARSPIPCRFTLVKDRKVAGQQEGRTADWTPSGSGRYRVEAELRVLGEWVPWVYANPIHLR